MAPVLDRTFRAVGEWISNFSIIVIALIVFVGVRAAVIAVSFCAVVLLSLPVIATVAFLFGPLHGGLREAIAVIIVMIAFIGSAWCVGWFVIWHVWVPHLRSAVDAAAIALFRHGDDANPKAGVETFAHRVSGYSDATMKAKSDKAG